MTPPFPKTQKRPPLAARLADDVGCLNNPRSSLIINVEYNQLDPILRATVSPEGDVNDPETGLSPFPGNTNNLVFMLEPYLKVRAVFCGDLPSLQLFLDNVHSGSNGFVSCQRCLGRQLQPAAVDDPLVSPRRRR